MTNRAGRRRRHKRHKARTNMRREARIEWLGITGPWRELEQAIEDMKRRLARGEWA
jgi:hypothetical protein